MSEIKIEATLAEALFDALNEWLENAPDDMGETVLPQVLGAFVGTVAAQTVDNDPTQIAAFMALVSQATYAVILQHVTTEGARLQ